MTRDVAPRLGHHKTSLIESRFFPALQARGRRCDARPSGPAPAFDLLPLAPPCCYRPWHWGPAGSHRRSYC